MFGKYIVCIWVMFAEMSGETCINAFYPQLSGTPDQPGYHEAVKQALHLQMQADSFQRVVEMQVLALASTPEPQKAGLRTAIRDNNAQAVALQKKAGERFAKVSGFEEHPRKADVDGNTVSRSQVAAKTDATPEPAGTKPAAEDEFAVLAKSPYSAADPVPINQDLPAGVIYKIQLGAFSKQLPENTFRGLTPVSGEKLDNGVIRYYVGLFRKYAGADEALRKVHEYGFKDAYIVSFYNRQVINIERAKQLEIHK